MEGATIKARVYGRVSPRARPPSPERLDAEADTGNAIRPETVRWAGWGKRVFESSGPLGSGLTRGPRNLGELSELCGYRWGHIDEDLGDMRCPK